MEPNDCPRFDGCSAPICPLDKDYLKRAHLKGERSCGYLREYAKPHARAILKGVIPAEQFQAISEAYSNIVNQYNPLKKQLNKASKTPTNLRKQSRKGKT